MVQGRLAWCDDYRRMERVGWASMIELAAEIDEYGLFLGSGVCGSCGQIALLRWQNAWYVGQDGPI